MYNFNYVSIDDYMISDINRDNLHITTCGIIKRAHEIETYYAELTRGIVKSEYAPTIDKRYPTESSLDLAIREFLMNKYEIAYDVDE